MMFKANKFLIAFLLICSFQGAQAQGLLSESNICTIPKSDITGPLSMLLRTDYQDVTCPQLISNITPLAIPLDGLSAKLEMLLGQKVAPELLEEQNPYMELDFSKAPVLDSIMVSYLVFRADFSGTILSRALAWHAQHGARVQLLVSEVIALDKDKKMFARLVRENPNFEIKRYKYKSPKKIAVRGLIQGLHRVLHAKIFLTHSILDPKASAVILGGRNVHDAFYFTTPKSRDPKWTDIVDYTAGDETFVHWHDFEVKIQSDNLVKSIADQYQALWNRNPKTGAYEHPFSSTEGPETVSTQYFETQDNEAIVRHFTSVPFSDKHALENMYANLIDSAKKSIFFSTPYFNLTPIIQDAVRRAVERGVKIKLVTRIELDGDTADIILSEVNKGSINRFKDSIEVYEYLVPNTILHSKFILIDGNVSLIGGINLNRRSFIHDIENGLLISSVDYYKKMEAIFTSYLSESRLITERQKIAFWKKIVIGLTKNIF